MTAEDANDLKKIKKLALQIYEGANIHPKDDALEILSLLKAIKLREFEK